MQRQGARNIIKKIFKKGKENNNDENYRNDIINGVREILKMIEINPNVIKCESIYGHMEKIMTNISGISCNVSHEFESQFPYSQNIHEILMKKQMEFLVKVDSQHINENNDNNNEKKEEENQGNQEFGGFAAGFNLFGNDDSNEKSEDKMVIINPEAGTINDNDMLETKTSEYQRLNKLKHITHEWTESEMPYLCKIPLTLVLFVCKSLVFFF